jgi:beta-N-acetylhexosaminidase
MKMRKLIGLGLMVSSLALFAAPLGQHALADDNANIPNPLDVLAALAAGAAKSVIAAFSTPEVDASLLDRQIGQMIMVGFAGVGEKDAGVAAVRNELAEGLIGGVVLYPENIRSAKQLKNLNSFLANAKSDPIPLIAVDQEGGLVSRLKRRNGYTNFPSARNVGRNPSYSTPESVVRLYGSMAHELADAGFNVNFGPVVDLSLNDRNRVIVQRKRSYGADPVLVANLARDFIVAHREANVVTVAKHFPGHGSSHADSHLRLADVSKTWREVELDPYRILAKDGMLDMVMVGHLYHPEFSDGEMLPASLSARAMDGLRDKAGVGFRGVIVSDDLEMGAVREKYSLQERVVKAVNAGTDLLVFSNVKSRDPELGAQIHAIMVKAVNDGTIPMARIEQAAGRIGLLKRRLMQHDLEGKW